MNVTDEMIDACIKANTNAKLFENGGPRDWVRAGLEAALSASPAGVKPKPLEWEELSERCWDADGMGKLYRVMKREDGTAKLKHGVYDHGTEYPSLEAAKSAAFSDYSTRIMSAIEPAGVKPAPADVYAVMKRYKENGRFDWDFVSQMCRDIAALPYIEPAGVGVETAWRLDKALTGYETLMNGSREAVLRFSSDEEFSFFIEAMSKGQIRAALTKEGGQ